MPEPLSEPVAPPLRDPRDQYEGNLWIEPPPPGGARLVVGLRLDSSLITGGNVTARVALDLDELTPEALDEKLARAREQLEEALREPRRACGYPGPWAPDSAIESPP